MGFLLLVVLTSLVCTTRGQFDLFDLDFLKPQLPVTLPHVTNSTHWADVTHEMVKQVADHCGWSRLCNATGWKKSYKEKLCSPCHECSCDDACYKRGDCCVDQVLDDSRDQLVLQTPTPAPPRYHCRNVFYTDYRDRSYAFMIDVCPESADADLTEKCANASLSDLEGHWPVVSRTTRSMYRNIHCAKCNGDVLDLVKWDVKIQCKDNVDLKDTSSQQAILDQVLNISDCHVSFDSPAGFQLQKCTPVKRDVISTCNATGLRQTYDALLWKACETFQSYVNDVDAAFSNVFCALCNFEIAQLSAVCPQCIPFPFVLVMSARALSKVVSSTSGRCVCPDSDIYDMYEMKCQKLHCSMTRQLEDKECSPLFGNSTGLAYDVTLRLTPGDVNNVVTLDSASSLEQVARNIRTSFLLGASSATGWDVQMDYFRVIAQAQGSPEIDIENLYRSVPMDGGDVVHVSSFLVRLKFATRWTEPVKDLERRLLTIINTTWNITVGYGGKKHFMATPFYNKPDPNDTQLFETVTLYSVQGNVTEYVIDITDTPSLYEAPIAVEKYLPVRATLSCPKVLFNYGDDSVTGENLVVAIDEDTGTVHHLVSGRHVSFEYVQVVKGRGVYICAEQLYDTLNKDVAMVTAKSLFPPALVYVSLVCQSLSAVCLLLALLTFCLFPSLQTLPGKNTMGLIVTLLLTTLLFEFGVARGRHHETCVVLGVLVHFFLLSAFTWMVICTVHMYRVFSHVITSRANETEVSACTFLVHVIVSVVVPATIVLATLIGNYYVTDNECYLDLGYGDGICYLSNRVSLILGSILPIGLAVVVNIVLFVLTLHALRRLSSERNDVTQRHHRQLTIYVKLSTLTGINWAVGLIAAAVDSEALWYAFLVLCGLQGVYVFLAVVCNKRVLKLYRGLVCRCRRRVQKSSSNMQREHGNGWTLSSSDRRLFQGDVKSSSLTQLTRSDNVTAISNTKL